MIDATAPDQAPARTDLTFLRRRTRPVRTVNPAIADFVAGRVSAHVRHPSEPSAPVAGGSGESLLDLGAPPPPGPSRAPVAPAVTDPLDLGAPSRPATSLDLDPPQSVSPRLPAQSTVSTSLDLGAPGPAAPQVRSSASANLLDLGAATAPRRPAPGSAASTSLDLGSPAEGGHPPAPRVQHGRVKATPARRRPRTYPGVPTILQSPAPTVALNRVQSGVGTLSFEAVVGPDAGDVRLGCAYQLRSGLSSTVQHLAGRRYAPPGHTRRPIVVASRHRFEQIEIDLCQVTELDRLIMYAFAGDTREIRWGGTLIATTFGGDRIEMPIELPPASAVVVLASVYQVRGELILRSEMDLIGRSVRDACRGYGFDRISWLDDSTPID